jgi:hypothetical protein
MLLFAMVLWSRVRQRRFMTEAAHAWRSALMKALVFQVVAVGFLSLGWFGLVGGFGGSDNPLWFYVAAVLQFPASLLFTTVLGLVAKVFPDDIQRIEVAGAVVAVLEFVLISVAIKKIRDFWLS